MKNINEYLINKKTQEKKHMVIDSIDIDEPSKYVLLDLTIPGRNWDQLYLTKAYINNVEKIEYDNDNKSFRVYSSGIELHDRLQTKGVEYNYLHKAYSIRLFPALINVKFLIERDDLSKKIIKLTRLEDFLLEGKIDRNTSFKWSFRYIKNMDEFKQQIKKVL